MASLGGVILAGGKSSRMGSPKAFLEIDCEYFISRIYRTLSEVFDSVTIIESERTNRYTFLTGQVFPDVYKDCGPLAAIHSAFVNSRNDVLFVASCDIPLLTVSLIDKLTSAYWGYEAIVPRTSEGVHPLCAVYHRDCMAKIDDYLKDGGRSIKGFLKQVNVLCIDLGPDEAKCLANVNTPEEYKVLLSS